VICAHLILYSRILWGGIYVRQSLKKSVYPCHVESHWLMSSSFADEYDNQVPFDDRLLEDICDTADCTAICSSLPPKAYRVSSVDAKRS
jgi:hypothetical protein